MDPETTIENRPSGLGEYRLPSIVKDLAAATSTAATVVNRYWLVLAFASIVFVLPRPAASAQSGIPLPFNLGSIVPGYFTVVAAFLLSALTIAFCSAHAHTHRVQRLVYRTLEHQDIKTASEQIHPADLFDALRLPSLSRVAPLAQVLRGKHQFFIDKAHCPRWLLLITAFYYVILKMVTWVVYLGVPATALVYVAWQHAMAPVPSGLPAWFPWSLVSGIAWAVLGVAGLALMQTLLAELLHLRAALRTMLGS